MPSSMSLLSSSSMVLLLLCLLSIVNNSFSLLASSNCNKLLSNNRLNRNINSCLHFPSSSSSLYSSIPATITLNGDDKSEQQFTVMNDFHRRQSLPIKVGPSLNIKGKLLTIWGVLYAVSTFVTALIVLPFMFISSKFCDLFGNKKQRKVLDWVVHIWAKFSMLLLLTRPRLYGRENLPAPGETVIYVPNHTSFMDILILSGFVPRPFKYLSKDEIKNIPVIGTAMNLAQHVFLRRDDLKSTLEVTETVVRRLGDGNSMVLFAEGTRSPDGSLKAFKKGAFQMAKAAGVRIVPVSIGNLHRYMPKDALMPLAPIRHTYIKIHPAIDTTDRPVSQIRALCHEAVNSGLPPYQQAPPPPPPPAVDSTLTLAKE